jgi:hypothetical protein
MNEEKEQKLREHRLIEATRKKLTGMRGKLWVIAQTLGGEIVSQQEGGTYRDIHYFQPMLPEPSNEWNPAFRQEDIPYMDSAGEEPVGGAWRDERDYIKTPQSTHDMGFHFDGLSRGMHLEIKCITDTKEITVHHQGYLVYKETAGSLEAYSPSDDWEGKIDRLFVVAQQKDDRKRAEEKQENLELDRLERRGWVEKMKERWGL